MINLAPVLGTRRVDYVNVKMGFKMFRMKVSKLKLHSFSLSLTGPPNHTSFPLQDNAKTCAMESNGVETAETRLERMTLFIDDNTRFHGHKQIIQSKATFIDWAQYRNQPKPSFKLWRSLLLDHLAVLKWLAVPSVLKNDISIMQ